jgi:site-specific DNA-cytosine methylase
MKYKVLGISSGLGVSLFTFKKCLIGNIEARGIFHTPKNEQWELNFSGIPLYKKWVREPSLAPDVIIGSPDCGSGSIFRLSRAKKYGDHKQNSSLTMFMEGVFLYQPKLFLFENLEGLFKSFPEKRV